MKQARILIVEDESIVAKDIQKTLQGLGYDVPCITFTGEEAVDKAGLLQPDLVLMDIILAGEMDGIEAARVIQNRYRIPVVYLTAYIDDSLVDNRETLECIIKPIDDDELRLVINRVLASPVAAC